MEHFFLNNPNHTIPKSITTDILEKEDARQFHKKLANYKVTPLHSLQDWATQHGLKTVYLKDESHRLGLNAFKGLGASFAIYKLLKNIPNSDTFCTATDGNHGRAVAWASKLHGKKAVIFVPRNTSKERLLSIKKEGAIVIQTEKDYDEACQIAKQQSIEKDWELVQDTAWQGYEKIPAYIMAGYKTIFQEIDEQLLKQNHSNIDVVMLQAGVGSFAAAAIWYFVSQYKKCPKLVIVEPYESDGILASFKAGKRSVPSGKLETIMAGLNCGIPSSTAWEIMKNCTDAAIKIDDAYVKKTMKELYHPSQNDPKIIAGESGAAGLAGLKFLMTETSAQPIRNHLGINSNSNVLVISTEGDTDKESFNQITTNTIL